MKTDSRQGDVVGCPTEYFCLHCRQLRLSLTADKTRCGNCGNKDLITGPVGSLDKADLVRKLECNKDYKL